ncbi:MAG: T9SS type A sorting domain-containing protein, partial [Candidatus Marinimicrobia bacterium]|nr:T9SS type A sorting domain-containing protein [Candidatus Neomarinimicrobiota bacterium]
TLSPSTLITLMSWSKPLQNKDGQMIATKGSHVNLYNRTYQMMGPQNNGLWVSSLHIDGLGEQYLSSQQIANLNQWTHTCLTYDSTVIKYYINGILNDSVIISGNVYQTSNPLYFGDQLFYATSDYKFYGNIDDIQIWNTALSQNEIQNYMSCPPTGNEQGLVGYWNFETGSGTTVYDQTSNGNNGTINGATWSTDVPFSGTTTTSALTWSVQAKASIGNYNDNDNYLGVASSATNTFDASYDILEPPASPGSSISLYIPHAEWDYLLGDNFSTDARPEVTLTDTMQVWDFVVKSTDAGTATLTFVYASVPSVPVVLENTATGARQTLSSNSTYTFTAVADSAHPFRVSIGDTTAPALALGASCTGPAILISDSTHSLGWTATDGFEVDSVMVSFSSDSGTTYTLQASLGTVSGYNWTVPDAVVMTGGKFKVKSQDYAGNSVEKVSDYVFAIAGDSLSSAVAAGWTLWGAPINPSNDSMTTNLSDDFSDYWDTFDYVNNGYTYDGILLEGEGYWLGAAQSATIDVKGTPIVSDFTMSLSQGWELISNPLVLDVSVDSLSFTKDAETKVYVEAVTAGWVNSIYGYSGTGYAVATTFSPWSGYWVAVLETGVDMTFPIHRHDGSDGSRSRDEGWMIAFNAEVDGANDEMMMVGYAETATDGFDADHDAVNPPNPPGPVYITLFTAHPEWDYFLGDKFTKDIRAEVSANGYQEWILSMESSDSEAQISWTFENVPDEYDIGYSINDGVYFDDMRSVNTTTLSVSTEIIVRVGTQVLSIDAEPIPEVYALRQNYPNPFNPVTTLRYDLPEEALVNITIYDMMGRVVKTMVNSQQNAGYKSIQWNATTDEGKPVSAGLYLYTIQAGEFRQTKKMVLLK